MQQLKGAKTEEETEKAKDQVLEGVQKEISDAIKTGASHDDLLNMVRHIQGSVIQLNQGVKQENSQAAAQISDTLLMLSKKIDENKKAEDKKIEAITEKLTDSRTKMKRTEDKEIQDYLQVLKKKKTDETEDRITFD